MQARQQLPLPCTAARKPAVLSLCVRPLAPTAQRDTLDPTL